MEAIDVDHPTVAHANTPNEQVLDSATQQNMGDDLHKKKPNQYRSKDGDNPRAHRPALVDQIEESLASKWEQFKLTEGAKPDYIDIDKDGDKKEPMKKAAKDAEEEQLDELSTDMYQRYDDAADAAIDYHDKSASQMNRRASSDDASDEDKERYKGRKEKHIHKLRNRERGRKRAELGMSRNAANFKAKRMRGE